MIDPETGRSVRVPEYIEAHVSGFDALSKHIRDFTPNRDGADLRGRSGAAARGRAHPRPGRAGDRIPGDRDLATRPRDGQRALFQDLLREGHLAGPNRELPRTLPVVVHTGRERWSAPLGARALTAPGPEALAPLQPDAACVLLDGPTLPNDDARRSPAAALIAVQSCAEASRMPERVAGLLGLLHRTGDAVLRKALCDGSRKMLEARFGGELPRRWTEKPAMLEHGMDEWEQEWFRQGREERLRQGIRRGREEGRAGLVVDARYVGQDLRARGASRGGG